MIVVSNNEWFVLGRSLNEARIVFAGSAEKADGNPSTEIL